jgi:hypothetical protein
MVFCNPQGPQSTGVGLGSIWRRARGKASDWRGEGAFLTEPDMRSMTATEALRQGQNAQALPGHMDATATHRSLRDKASVHFRPHPTKRDILTL